MLRQAAVPILIGGILVAMFLPLPVFFIDFLIISNIAFALLLLLSALFISDPIKLSALPAVLLIAVLYRLSLNIATTRLILSEGHAGMAIEAFGSMVIQGSALVGLIIFSIISIVQFLVIAKGSERVAEVSARFSLDAMPGRQMAIDADVRSGLLDIETARSKRAELQTESRFYGALDGAMKFVKGDAVAGIIIFIINMVAGLALGLAGEGLKPAEALSKYTMLSIGDGLSAQIPALLNSIAAALIVTRVSEINQSSLSAQLFTQVLQSKEAKNIAAAICMLASLLPGIPFLPPTILALLLYSTNLKPTKPNANTFSPPPQIFVPRVPPLVQIALSKICAQELAKSPDFTPKIDKMRLTYFLETGLIINRPDLTALAEENCHFKIIIRGIEAYTSHQITGNYLDAIIDNLTHVIRTRAVELIDDILTRRIIDHFDKEAPELVSAVVPTIASINDITFIFKALLEEGIPVINMDLIMQALAGIAPRETGRARMLEEVRIALKSVICKKYFSEINTVVGLNAIVDIAFSECAKQNMPIPSEYVESLLADARKFEKKAVLVVSRTSRQIIKDILVSGGCMITVLAHEELEKSTQHNWIGILAEKMEVQPLLNKIAA